MGGIPPFQTHPTALKLFVYLGIGWHASVCLLNSFNLWVRFPSHSYFVVTAVAACGDCLAFSSDSIVYLQPHLPVLLAYKLPGLLDSKPARKTCRRYVRPKTSSMLQPLWGGLRTLLGAPSSDDSERQVSHFDNIKMFQSIETTLVMHCLYFLTTIKCYPVVNGRSGFKNSDKMGACWSYDLSFPSTS